MDLTPEGYRPRIVDAQIDRYLRIFGAVCVEGPKFCGKTWTSEAHCTSEFKVGDPSNNFQNRTLARIDVGYALDGEAPHLIDEWQEVPGIWDAVRSEVDSSSENGRFVLTGSSTPKAKGVMHSGAGRIVDIPMRTMTLFESGDSDGRVSLASLFDGSFQDSLSHEHRDLRRIIDLTVRGGWPQHIRLSPDDAQDAIAGYMVRVVKDASTLDGNLSEETIGMVLRSLARNESTIASYETLLRDIAQAEGSTVSSETYKKYREALGRIFLIRDQPSFDPSYRSPVRVGKAPKRHLTDPALAAVAMGMSSEMLINDLQTYGFLFEAMCERDLDVYAQANRGRMFHYRDHDGREIDAVVEMPNGRWGAFEIRLGTNQIDDAAENLLKVDRYFEKKGARRRPTVLAVICGMTASAYRRPDGVYVIPITSLRP